MIFSDLPLGTLTRAWRLRGEKEMAKILARLSAAHIGRPYRYQLAGVRAEFVGTSFAQNCQPLTVAPEAARSSRRSEARLSRLVQRPPSHGIRWQLDPRSGAFNTGGTQCQAIALNAPVFDLCVFFDRMGPAKGKARGQQRHDAVGQGDAEAQTTSRGSAALRPTRSA